MDYSGEHDTDIFIVKENILGEIKFPQPWLNVWLQLHTHFKVNTAVVWFIAALLTFFISQVRSLEFLRPDKEGFAQIAELSAGDVFVSQ